MRCQVIGDLRQPRRELRILHYARFLSEGGGSLAPHLDLLRGGEVVAGEAGARSDFPETGARLRAVFRPSGAEGKAQYCPFTPRTCLGIWDSKHARLKLYAKEIGGGRCRHGESLPLRESRVPR